MCLRSLSGLKHAFVVVLRVIWLCSLIAFVVFRFVVVVLNWFVLCVFLSSLVLGHVWC